MAGARGGNIWLMGQSNSPGPLGDRYMPEADLNATDAKAIQDYLAGNPDYRYQNGVWSQHQKHKARDIRAGSGWKTVSNPMPGATPKNPVPAPPTMADLTALLTSDWERQRAEMAKRRAQAGIGQGRSGTIATSPMGLPGGMDGLRAMLMGA